MYYKTLKYHFNLTIYWISMLKKSDVFWKSDVFVVSLYRFRTRGLEGETRIQLRAALEDTNNTILWLKMNTLGYTMATSVASITNLHKIGDMSWVATLRMLVGFLATFSIPKSKTTIPKDESHSEISDFEAILDFLLGIPWFPL